MFFQLMTCDTISIKVSDDITLKIMRDGISS